MEMTGEEEDLIYNKKEANNEFRHILVPSVIETKIYIYIWQENTRKLKTDDAGFDAHSLILKG